MTGETDITRLLAGMDPVLGPQLYVFCLSPDGNIPPDAVMSFHEAEGLTLILSEDAATPALSPAFPCRRITLNIHSSLGAVGFLAAVTTRLAADGISVNPVAGYYHDHLFVPAEHAEPAMALLLAMTREKGGR